MIRIEEVISQSQLKKFVDFPYKLYSDDPNWIPPLRFDEMNTLQKGKNPAFQYCRARYWLAYKGDELAGRIAGIINERAIEKWGNKFIRFGWFDFIDDPEVAKCLLEQVEAWAKEEGLNGVQGPMGFCDLDKEGMLVEGFELEGTFTCLYNYPYYPVYMEQNGYTKDVDWLEYLLEVPEKLDDTVLKVAEMVEKRYNLTLISFEKTKDILKYAHGIFDLIDEAYSSLYNVVPLNEDQVKFYINQYFSSVNPDFVKIVLDQDDNMAAFALGIPSLSKAFKKAKGRLFPFGFVHLLKALKKNDSVDLLLVAVRPDLQGKGVNAMLMKGMAEACWKNGIKKANCNPQLEGNLKVRSQWKYFTGEQNKRRRCYIKVLD